MTKVCRHCGEADIDREHSCEAPKRPRALEKAADDFWAANDPFSDEFAADFRKGLKVMTKAGRNEGTNR